MAGELCGGVDGSFSQEEPAGHGKPDIADDIRITEETRETVPVWQFELAFGAVNRGSAKRYRKADGGVEELVVVGEVIYVAAKIVGVKAEVTEKAFGGADLKVIAVRGLDREAEDVRAKRDDGGRTG